MVEEHWRELNHRLWLRTTGSGRVTTGIIVDEDTCGGMRGDPTKGSTVGDVGHGLGVYWGT